jgi:ParB family chromosome partitioning protein
MTDMSSKIQTRLDQLRDVKLDLIEPSNFNVRDIKDANKDLEILKESMRNQGLIQPIVVVPKGDKFQLLVGQRRWLAAKGLGWDKIPAIVLAPVSEREGKIISAIENLQRKELSFSDQVKIAEYLFEDLKDKVGKKSLAKEIGKLLGISENRATTLLKRAMIPPEIAKMVDNKELKRNEADKIALATWPNEAKAVELAEKIRTLTKDEKSRLVDIATELPEASTAKWVEEAKKPSKTVEYRLILPTKWAGQLTKAAEERDEDPEDTIKSAVIEWLEAKGFS